MSGECVYNLVASSSAAEPAMDAAATTASAPRRSRKAPPPTASTFGIHGTSAVLANAGGEHTEPSTHPAKKPIGTFGRDVGSTVDPNNFLRKNAGPMTASRGAATVDKTDFKKSTQDRTKRKADIPDRNERPVMGMRTDKNYVVANAVEATMAIPAKSQPVPPPRATDREDFGQVPDYLQDIKSELATRKAHVAAYMTAVGVAQERWSELSAAEVSQLRSGLQSRWDVLNKEFQRKGFTNVETPSQRLHQEQVEKQLNAVEYALQKLSRHHVFIYNDQK